MARPADVWSAEEWGGLPVVMDEDIKFGSLDINPSIKSTAIEAVRVPNPCTDSDFRTPVYEFTDFHITKTYLNSTPGIEYPYRVTISNTIRDTANGYTMQCSSEHRKDTSAYYGSVFTECVAGSDDRFQSLIAFNVYERLFDALGRTNSSTLELQQVWYCARRGDGSYP